MTGNCRFFGLTVAADNLQTPKPMGRFFRCTWIYPATTSKDGSSLELNFWNGQRLRKDVPLDGSANGSMVNGSMG